VKSFVYAGSTVNPPEYAMILQVLMKNHIDKDRTVVRTIEGTAARTAEVVV
jgi:hypothetical protein